MLQEEWDSLEFAELLALEQMDPCSEERADLRAAIIAATMVNMWRGKSGRAAKPDDFMPDFDRGAQKQSPTDMWATLMAAAKSQEERLKRNGGNRNTGS